MTITYNSVSIITTKVSMNLGSQEDFFRNVAYCEQTWESSYRHLYSNIDWATAVQYLFENGRQFQIDRDIVHSAVHLMERILVEYATKNELDALHFLDVQLHSIACLTVSAKYEGGVVPDIPKFLQACERTDVTSAQFLVAEFEVLRICQQLRRYPPIVIVAAVINSWYCVDVSADVSTTDVSTTDDDGQNVHTMAGFLSDIVIISFDLHAVYPPSLIAEAILMTIEMVVDNKKRTSPLTSSILPSPRPRRPMRSSPYPKESIEGLFGTIVTHVIREYPNHPCGVSIAAAMAVEMAAKTLSAMRTSNPTTPDVYSVSKTTSIDSPTCVFFDEQHYNVEPDVGTTKCVVVDVELGEVVVNIA